jgi:hypothetical protein
MSGVFQNIDPHPLNALRVCTPPLWCWGRTHSLGGEEGGQYFGRCQTLLCTLYVSVLWAYMSARCYVLRINSMFKNGINLDINVFFYSVAELQSRGLLFVSPSDPTRCPGGPLIYNFDMKRRGHSSINWNRPAFSC